MEGRGQAEALIPAVGLLVLALYCGTFAGGASAGGAVTAHLILWLAGFYFAIWVAAPGRRRGAGREAWQSGAILLVAWAAVAWPWWASPVPRAGSSAVVLVPMFLILPWVVARCWRADEAGRERAQRGAFGVALVVAAVSVRALWGWLRLGTDGASLPLGHHNLLAAFLVTTLPLAALACRSRGVYRWTAGASVALGVAALLATRSLAGALGLAAMVVVWGWSRRRAGDRRSVLWTLGLAVGTVVGLGLVFGHRILAVITGTDPSASARLGYWRAGWRGISERPMLGWGPGSTPWTVHEHFRPIPGIHPADQVLPDLHSLPLQLVYELGLVGCGLLLAAAWCAWRLLRRRPLVDRGLVTAGLAGLLGFVVVSALAGLSLSVSAVSVAAALAAGAVFAGLGVESKTPLDWNFLSIVQVLGVSISLTLAGWVLQRQDQAHLAYEKAMVADSDPTRTIWLRAAVALDPEFPLYRWRLAQMVDDPALFRQAARNARSVSALWLTARDWDAACRLSPLGAVAPFRASLESGDAAIYARALAAQPWLLAAVEWRHRAALVDEGVEILAADPRLEIGWRSELRDAWARVRTTEGNADSVRRLVLKVDEVPATSLSLYSFRRRPWPTRIAEIRLDSRRLGLVSTLPPATALPTTDPSLFRSSSCALGSPRTATRSPESERDADRRP